MYIHDRVFIHVFQSRKITISRPAMLLGQSGSPQFNWAAFVVPKPATHRFQLKESQKVVIRYQFWNRLSVSFLISKPQPRRPVA